MIRQRPTVTAAGTGDTVPALNLAGVAGDTTRVCTARRAFVEPLDGKTLPGIAAPDGAAKAA